MFGKEQKRRLNFIEDNISTIKDHVRSIFEEVISIDEIRNHNEYILRDVKHLRNQADKTIKYQQKTIEALANALCNKYEHGIFIYSQDGEMPTVIRDGKLMTDDFTQAFSIDWTIGNFPNISIEQGAVTLSRDEGCE